MEGIGKYGVRAIPMAVVMGIIFYLSHQPGGTFQLPQIKGLDKILHACIYAVLGLSTCFVFPFHVWRQRAALVSTGVILFCLMFGITDEIHQSFIVGRDPSGTDVVADVVGAFVAVALYRYLCPVVAANGRRCMKLMQE